jgi:hypothetical protein
MSRKNLLGPPYIIVSGTMTLSCVAPSPVAPLPLDKGFKKLNSNRQPPPTIFPYAGV